MAQNEKDQHEGTARWSIRLTDKYDPLVPVLVLLVVGYPLRTFELRDNRFENASFIAGASSL